MRLSTTEKVAILAVILAIVGMIDPSLVHRIFEPILGCRGPGCS